jgi:hypothetical protein
LTNPAFQESKKQRVKSKKIAVITLTFCLFLVACLATPVDPTPTPEPEPSATATEDPTETPTIIWFPATETPTPFASLQPTATPFPSPPLGEIQITDDFDDASLWSLLESTRGSAALGINELTIVLNEPRAYVSATRVDVYLTDFYLEATASTSLCAGQDEYGMILRAASPSDFYRLSLSCDGQLRLDQIRGGTASSPLPWTLSAAVPRNAPGTVRIGVWADGGVMHIFFNDTYQVSINTSLIPGGTIGFFARSAGQNAVTINFSDLSVWALER